MKAKKRRTNTRGPPQVAFNLPVRSIMKHSGNFRMAPGVLTVPELIPDGPLPSNMPKVDVWLLGIVAAEALSGTLLTDTSARQIRAQLQEQDSEGSAWELFVPRDVAEKLDTHAVDFLRQCFLL